MQLSLDMRLDGPQGRYESDDEEKDPSGCRTTAIQPLASHSLPNTADVKECVELYLHSPYTFPQRTS